MEYILIIYGKELFVGVEVFSLVVSSKNLLLVMGMFVIEFVRVCRFFLDLWFYEFRKFGGVVLMIWLFKVRYCDNYGWIGLELGYVVEVLRKVVVI